MWPGTAVLGRAAVLWCCQLEAVARGAGFWPCCTGVFAGGGGTVKGAWEGSADGSRWEHDFGLDYPRPG